MAPNSRAICSSGSRLSFIDLANCRAPNTALGESPNFLRSVGHPPGKDAGARSQQRQPPVAVTIDDDAEPIGAAEIDTEDDASEADDEDEDDIEIDPDIAGEAD